jgi:hypothetical protein
MTFTIDVVRWHFDWNEMMEIFKLINLDVYAEIFQNLSLMARRSMEVDVIPPWSSGLHGVEYHFIIPWSNDGGISI